MEQRTKMNLLIACGGVLVGGLLGGGTVWLWQQNQNQCSTERANVAESQQKVSQLQGEGRTVTPNESANPGSGGSTPLNKPNNSASSSGMVVSDQDYLKILTANEMKPNEVGDHWLPIVQHYIDGKWAQTMLIPIKKSQEQGFYVPPASGPILLWHKKDGKWHKIGSCGASVCDYVGNYKSSDLPVAMRRE